VQSLGVDLSKTQSVKMTGDGHLQLLDGSGKVLWTSPQGHPVHASSSPTQRVRATTSIKIIDENGGSLWESTN
jgi:hypothetical protein